MQLEPGQKSILAFFPTDTQARQAAAQLNNIGCQDLQVDRISRFSNPVNNRSTGSISSMVLGDAGYTASHPTLMAADPAVSGMSTGYDLPGGTAFMLTVVTDQEHVQAAVDLIKQQGGQV